MPAYSGSTQIVSESRALVDPQPRVRLVVRKIGTGQPTKVCLRAFI